MVKTCDLQTAWKTLNTFVKFSLCVIDESLTCSVELLLLSFFFFPTLTEICVPNPVQQLFFLFQFRMLRNGRGHLSIYAFTVTHEW